MTLLFQCPQCDFAHDEKIEANKIKLVICPQCEFTYYIELKLWKKGEKYYGTGMNSIPLEGMKQTILNKEV